MSANLLVELFTEELPPKALRRLGEAFAGGVFDGLKGSGLLDATSKAKAFATPRRLAVYIYAVLPKGSDRPVEQKLMPAAIALKNGGGWSDALRKKLAGMGREQLADMPANSRIGSDSLAIKPEAIRAAIVAQFGRESVSPVLPLRPPSAGGTKEKKITVGLPDAATADTILTAVRESGAEGIRMETLYEKFSAIGETTDKSRVMVLGTVKNAVLDKKVSVMGQARGTRYFWVNIPA